MTAETPPRGRPVDLARDDELLDALGRGELPVEDDEVAVMLAAWRRDVTDPGTDERARTPVRAAVPPLYPVPNLAAPNVAGRRRWSRRRRLAIAAAVVALAGGGTAAAAAASTTQGSPLWPVTRLLYPQRADRVAAEDTLAQARQAVSEGRRDDARRLLDKADALIAQVDDPGDRARLLVELGQLRQLLSEVTGAVQPGQSTAPQNQPSGGPGPTSTSKSTPSPLLPTLLPSLLPSPLPTSLLPTLPPLPGIGG